MKNNSVIKNYNSKKEINQNNSAEILGNIEFRLKKTKPIYRNSLTKNKTLFTDWNQIY